LLTIARLPAWNFGPQVLDHRANGYVRGEGVVLFCLGARNSATGAVEAIWMGSAINSDGRSSALTAPNGIAQMLVISQGERVESPSCDLA